MADMYKLPIERNVVVNLEYVRAVIEHDHGGYSLLVSGQWVYFTPEEKDIAKGVVETYFGEWQGE